MPDVTRDTQPRCEHCGLKIRRLAGVWIHSGNGDTHCPDTTAAYYGTHDATANEDPHPVAAPRDEIR